MWKLTVLLVLNICSLTHGKKEIIYKYLFILQISFMCFDKCWYYIERTTEFKGLLYSTDHKLSSFVFASNEYFFSEVSIAFKKRKEYMSLKRNAEFCCTKSIQYYNTSRFSM